MYEFSLFIDSLWWYLLVLHVHVMQCCCYLQGFNILATAMVMSWWILSCNSAHLRRLYGAAPLGDQTTSTMIQNPTQSHYHDAKLTSPCHIRVMPSAWVGSNKSQFYKSLVWHGWDSNSQPSAMEAYYVPIGPRRPVTESRDLANWEVMSCLVGTSLGWDLSYAKRIDCFKMCKEWKSYSIMIILIK